jgi:hypothetical protein
MASPLTIRFPQDERAKIFKIARANRMAPSSWMRRVLLNALQTNLDVAHVHDPAKTGRPRKPARSSATGVPAAA